MSNPSLGSAAGRAHGAPARGFTLSNQRPWSPAQRASRATSRLWVVLSTALLWALALGACGRDALIDGDVGDACFSDEDCGSGLVCDGGRCLDDGIVDPNPDPNPGEVCDPGERVCLDDSTVGLCDGAGFEPVQSCGRGGCEDGRCVDDPPCPEGSRRCSSQSSTEICLGGRFVPERMCGPEEACQGGNCVPAERLPDIAVVEVGFGPTSVSPGQRISADLQVANLSEVRSPGFSCVFNLSANGGIDLNRDITIGRVNIRGLGGLEGEGAGFSGPLPPNVRAGTYRVYAFCDPSNAVAERDEMNNVQVAGPSLRVADGGGQPDLIVDGIFVETDVVQEGDPIVAFGIACNVGQSPAEGVEIRIDAVSERDPDRVLFEMSQSFINFLAPGDCLDFIGESQARCDEDGQDEAFFVRGIVDPNNRIRESDERNNVGLGSPPVFVNGCGQMQCGDRFDPENVNRPPVLSPGGYSLELCPNDIDTFGLAATAGQQLRLLLETDPRNVFTVTLFSVRGDRRERVSFLQTMGGVIEQDLRVPDNADRLIATIEARNLVETSYSLFFEAFDDPGEDADLFGLGLELAPVPNLPGQAFQAISSILNDGFAPASNFDVAFFVVPGRADDPNRRVRVGALIVDGIGPGEIIENVTDLRLPQNLTRGPHVVVMLIDERNSVPERDESNNVLTTPFTIGEVVNECQDDMFEPNNSNMGAFELEPATYEGLRVCPDDDGHDFFRVCPEEGSALSVTVRFTGAEADIDVRLFDEGLRVVDSSNSLDNTEQVEVEATSGCYVVEVFLFANNPPSGASYDMEISVTPPDVGQECTSAFEPNNTFGQARNLFEAARAPVLDFCPRGDADFYSVVLGEGSVLTVSANPLGDQPPGELVLAIYDPDSNFITQRFAREPTLTLQVDVPGTYFLRLVTSSGADLFQYNVDIEIE